MTPRMMIMLTMLSNLRMFSTCMGIYFCIEQTGVLFLGSCAPWLPLLQFLSVPSLPSLDGTFLQFDVHSRLHYTPISLFHHVSLGCHDILPQDQPSCLYFLSYSRQTGKSTLPGIADDVLLQFQKAVVFPFLLQPSVCLPHSIDSKRSNVHSSYRYRAMYMQYVHMVKHHILTFIKFLS